MSSIIIIDKPSKTPWLKPLLQPRETPKRLWELHVKIPVDEGAVYGRAIVSSFPEAGLFSEQTEIEIWTDTYAANGTKWRLDVDGVRDAGYLDMQVHIIPSSTKMGVMMCEGRASSDETSFEGTWNMACLEPATCGCEGIAGTFRMHAV